MPMKRMFAVQLRLAQPPGVNCADVYGNTALHLAAARGQREVVVLLLQNGVNTTLRNSRGLHAVLARVTCA